MSSKLMNTVLVWGGVVLVAATACGTSSDNKKKAPYTGDDDSAGAGATAGKHPGSSGDGPGSSRGGAGDGVAGDGSTSGGEHATATGGEGGSEAGGGTNPGGASQGGDSAGGSDSGGPVPVLVNDPQGRGTTGALVLQVTTAQSPAIVGQPVQYSLSVGNTSKVAVKGVNLLFRVPKGLQLYFSSALPASSYCGNAVCSENEEATWDLGDIPAGAFRTIQLDPVVLNDVGDGDTVTPQIRLSATDLDPLTLTPSLPVVESVPVELTLGSDAEPVMSGDELELSVDLGHIGDAAVFTGKLKLELPGWLQATDISDGGVDERGANETISWGIDSVPVGSSFRRLVKVKVVQSPLVGDVLNPRATFTYEDAVVANVAQLPLGVIGKASPLQLRVEAAEDPVVPGNVATYLVTVSNPSQRAVDGVTLYQRVPSDESLYFSNAEPDASYCGNAVCTADELASWTLGTLEAGTSETITIPPSIVAQAAGDGSLVSSFFQLDAIGVSSLRRTKTIAAHAKPAAQLMLGTAFSPATPGQKLSYDVDVGQIGPGSLQDSVLTLELPAEVSAGSASDGGVVNGATVSWDLGAIAGAQTAHRSIDVTIDAATPIASVLHARATLTFKGGQERDAVSEFALPLVTETLPLSVTVGATPSPIVLGNTMSYTTTIKNTAARTIDGVNLLLRLPPGHAFNYATGSDPDSSYCGNAICNDYEEATWALGSMASGSSKIVNVNPTASANLVAGSLVTFRQRLTAVDLGGTIMLQSTVPTKK